MSLTSLPSLPVHLSKELLECRQCFSGSQSPLTVPNWRVQPPSLYCHQQEITDSRILPWPPFAVEITIGSGVCVWAVRNFPHFRGAAPSWLGCILDSSPQWKGEAQDFELVMFPQWHHTQLWDWHRWLCPHGVWTQGVLERVHYEDSKGERNGAKILHYVIRTLCL